jgi:hypothetical protein
VAVLACAVNIYLTHEKKIAINDKIIQEQKWQSIAAIDIHDGIDELCSVFIKMQPQDEELFFIDFFNYEPIFDRLKNPEFIRELNSTNVESACWWNATDFPTIKTAISKGVSNAISSLNLSIAKYGSHLDAETSQDVSSIQKHPFINSILSRESGPIIDPVFKHQEKDYLDLITRLRNLNRKLCKGITPQLLLDQEPNLSGLPLKK